MSSQGQTWPSQSLNLIRSYSRGENEAAREISRNTESSTAEEGVYEGEYQVALGNSGMTKNIMVIRGVERELREAEEATRLRTVGVCVEDISREERRNS